MTGTLWLRFSEESSLPSLLTEEERTRLDAVFNPADPDSGWSRAGAMLGLRFPPGQRLLRWHEGAPYINWTQLCRSISAGWITPVPDAAAPYRYALHYRLSGLPAFTRIQWRIARFLAGKTDPETALPGDPEEAIAESLALGIAMLSLTMRLPAHDPAALAGWLAEPAGAPASLRRPLTQLQAAQLRRTSLSFAWHRLFPPRADAGESMPGPAFFWNEPQAASAPSPAAQTGPAEQWKGLAISGKEVTARALLNPTEAMLAGMQGPVAAVFAQARPETVNLFPLLAAALYGEGGAMSHACTVAREQNLPCITALGRGFIAEMKRLGEAGEVWLDIEPRTGEVRLVRR